VILEHTFVMAAYLGRPLARGEQVHHRNGVRGDNTVGPCATSTRCGCADGPHNLELWSISHPSGQRVLDQVEWAKRILARYEPDSLRNGDESHTAHPEAREASQAAV
jgi:hypothetical protein